MSFATLLVANRGEIARRVMRTARAMGIRCVAVYAQADAEAPFLADADLALRLPGSYLDADALLEAARRSGAEAIHPGYGFLSENAAFARQVLEAGLAWVGPSPETIARMGDKLAAKALARQVGVPILPADEDPAKAATLGYPLLVKATAGGGGKGMRIVEAPGELEAALAAARREARSGFGDERVFLERHLPRCRHVEIQILGDVHGALVHLGERECSVQRRHQKILEESPSSRVDASLREAMGEAALRLGRGLGYHSAGTVEFLLDDETGEFFLLEVNTRLQVEHPVTEAVTGIDLVREQLRIAAGEPLDIAQEAVRWEGSAIEARLYAESPAVGFLPSAGTLYAFEPPASPAVRWDTGVASGCRVGTDFDPLLAKVIAHAPTRREAAARLALALERCHLGGLETNRDFLVASLRTPAFLSGDTTTDFIERVAPARALDLDREELLRAGQTAALWLQARNRASAPVLARVPSGWRNARLPDSRLRFAWGEREVEVRYRARRDGTFIFGDGSAARLHGWDEGHIDLEIDGRRRRSRITRATDRILVQTLRGDVELLLLPRFPAPSPELRSGGLLAPMPGQVSALHVAQGDAVAAGDVLVVLEAMKMEHPIRAPEAGKVVELRVAVGDQVQRGTLLLVVEPAREAGEAEEVVREPEG